MNKTANKILIDYIYKIKKNYINLTSKQASYLLAKLNIFEISKSDKISEEIIDNIKRIKLLLSEYIINRELKEQFTYILNGYDKTRKSNIVKILNSQI